MKDIKKFILESAKEITVMPSQEGYIDEIDLSVDDYDISKNTIKKLEKYFPIDTPVHIYNDYDWDKTLDHLWDECTDDKKVDEIEDNNSTIFVIYKYNDNYIATVQDEYNTQAIIISGEFKL